MPDRTFHESVVAAVNMLVSKTRSRRSLRLFTYSKLSKSLKSTVIHNFEELKNMKYVGDKIFSEIKYTMEKGKGKIIEEKIVIDKSNNTTNLDEELAEIKYELNHLSSNLSDLEIKYGIKKPKNLPENKDLIVDEKQSDDIIIETDSVLVENNNSFDNIVKERHDIVEKKDFIISVDRVETNGILDFFDSTDFKNDLNEINKITIEENNRMSQNTFIDKSTVLKNEYKLDIKNEKTKITRKRRYVPQLNTVPYCILKGLYFYSNNEGIHKYILYSKVSKWLGMDVGKNDKVLIKRNLITLVENKYYLTTEGTELCEKLFRGVKKEIETNNNELTLVIDSREKKNNRNRIYFQHYFMNTANIKNVETRMLEVGDFVWIKNEKVLNFIIERKANEDFRLSVTDGRYLDQLKRLKIFDFQIFYLIENLTKRNDNLNKLVKKSLTGLKIQKNVTVIETKNTIETAQFISKLNMYIKENEEETEELCGYGSFLEEGDKNRTLTVNSIFIEALSSIKRCTREKAKLIGEKYHSVFELIQTIQLKGEEFIKKEIIMLLITHKLDYGARQIASDIVRYFT
ncbi:MUS81 [Hepatospora eriocheir]|uniref:Crossover junction endonuclease MUS81 n=1 Tax=Hepatospora eriocheir TaxID=1081669 RepID=A0A1X0QHV1_9MICR|nr:MUS81 [Hepatospora eriocheir]